MNSDNDLQNNLNFESIAPPLSKALTAITTNIELHEKSVDNDQSLSNKIETLEEFSSQNIETLNNLSLISTTTTPGASIALTEDLQSNGPTIVCENSSSEVPIPTYPTEKCFDESEVRDFQGTVESAVTVSHDFTVRGTMHQGNNRFDENSRGIQCTAMSAASILYSTFKSPILWSTKDIDNILIKGDELFKESIKNRAEVHPDEEHGSFLSPAELITTTSYNGNRYLLNLTTEDIMYGRLDLEYDGFCSLRQCIQNIFQCK